MKTYSTLIAGLGNPGDQYADTRHNFGFLAIDRLIEACGGPSKCPELEIRGDCLTYECRLAGNMPPLLLAKPQTYMNLSGLAVAKLASKFAIEPANVCVMHDDLDLPLGRMKLKKGGGDAGHNGIKSIVQEMGSAGFVRLRMGIGRPQTRGTTRDYVLDAFSPDETALVETVLDTMLAGVRLWLRRGLQPAVQHINASDARPPENSEDS